MFSITLIALSALLLSVSAQDCSRMPLTVHPSECCPDSCPKFMTRALAEECGLKDDITMHCNWGLAGSVDPGALKGSPPPCAAFQCVLKKNNLLTADNKLDKTAYKKFAGQQFTAEWNPTIANAFSTCDAEADKPDDCDGRRYITCIKRNMFMNCPASIAVQSPDCSSLRAYMNKCHVPYSFFRQLLKI